MTTTTTQRRGGNAPPDPTAAAFAERLRLIARESDPKRRRAMKVLYDIDLQTWSPALRPKRPDLAFAIDQLRVYLPWRNRRRAALALRGRDFHRLQEDGQWTAEASLVAPHFRRVLCQAAGQGKGKDKNAWDRELLASSFCRFACGDLQFETKGKQGPPEDGVPDGAMFFCFTEAALYFASLGLDRAFWLELLPTFVVGTELFVHHCWSGRGRCVDDYGPRFVKQHTLTDPGMTELRRSLAALPAEQWVRRFNALCALGLTTEATSIRPDELPELD